MKFKEFVFACVAVAAAHSAIGQSPAALQVWTVNPRPSFDVGSESLDTNETFGIVRGVARTPAGEVVVADQNSRSLRYFSANGKFLRSVSRQGDGPGEFQLVINMLHCGDSLVVMDGQTHRWSVFSVAGRFKRSFFMATIRSQSKGGPQAASGAGDYPYEIRCNSSGFFVSQGWENMAEAKAGVYRTLVPFWLGSSDGAISSRLGEYPGSERWGSTDANGRQTGGGPLPLGREPVIAIGRTRAYVGTADSFVIMVFGLDGKPAGTIRKSLPPVRTTPADIARFITIDTSGVDDRLKKSNLRIDAQVKWPATLPSYAALLIDSDDNLWVQRYPRPAERTSHWMIFSPTGSEIAQAELPANLIVHEIGRDYVLGVMPEPPDGVHHVEVFTLTRGS